MTVISNENQAPAMGNVPVHGLTLREAGQRGRQHNLRRTIRRSNVCFSCHAIFYWSQTHYYFHCICICKTEGKRTFLCSSRTERGSYGWQGRSSVWRTARSCWRQCKCGRNHQLFYNAPIYLPSNTNIADARKSIACVHLLLICFT